MTITKLKAKNQLTIPIEVVRKLHLQENEFLSIDIEDNYIKLTPVEIEPRYSTSGSSNIEAIMVKEKNLFGKYGSGKGDLSKKRKKYLKGILDGKHRNS